MSQNEEDTTAKVLQLLATLIDSHRQLQSDIQAIKSTQQSLITSLAFLSESVAILETNHTTLLHTLTKGNRSLSTVNDSIAFVHTSLSESMSKANRELSIQLLKLQNPTTKFYTRITNLPMETVHEIFSWILPKQVVRFRRLSRTFNSFLVSKAFAKMNLTRFVGVTHQRGREEGSGELVESTFLTEYDEMLFFLPKSFQSFYVERYMWDVESISWYRGHVGSTVFPRALCSLPKLKKLDLSQCRLKGPIIPEIALLSSVSHLNLAYNFLSGSIPVEVFGMTRLVSLHLNSNELVGPIAPEIGNLVNLTHLNLSGNPGSHPNELGMKEGHEIPKELGNLVLLRVIFIKNEVLGWQSSSEKADVIAKLVNLEDSDLWFIPVYYDF
ncbi:UNVERIFIED_CONTAM: hypothetical protein HDU68_003524 [Siphonaria sp. JEL0065]|nr:hypothetical protein HDU68_003524 [Siphonaria sp. JEL0065]